jgi:hypothetical protein
MITHNNLNYFITYILFSCIGHEEILLQFQQTLAPTVPWCPLKQNNILLNIAPITQSSNTAAHTLLVSIN